MQIAPPVDTSGCFYHKTKGWVKKPIEIGQKPTSITIRKKSIITLIITGIILYFILKEI